MTTTLQAQVLRKLKVAAIQYEHEKFLKIRHFTDEEERFISNVIPRYQAKLDYYFGFTDNCKAIKRKAGKKTDPRSTLSVRSFKKEEDIQTVARQTSVYYQQGLEMFETSILMPENTSPLVEYYALLQCAKGYTILDLHQNEEKD